ncbi:diguanylate cyclase (GGDEF)-like protein [Clostridium algifaecis]|uniref:Diguanylate cyclase (GGDEF)-like protein n=2 Tax=Clostridium algifaecis TaxID=1472040 RepID=A0ABS4KV53_9CLOT|nr:diguanylate cyclase (GGDEF)-like protein [Clostridium algifaecis]
MRVGVNMEFKFSEFIDLPKFKALIKNFYDLTGIICLIEHNEKIINLFPKYNNELIRFRFDDYDKYIIKQIKNKKKYGIAKSKSGLMYIGLPIYVEKESFITIFTSAIFYKEPDSDFLNSLKSSNFIKDIPVYSNEKITEIIKIMCNTSSLIENMISNHIKDINSNLKLIENFNKLTDDYNNVKKIAYYDELTNLPNRNYLKHEMERQINLNPEKTFILFYVEMNDFKNVNDIYGYEYGDKLLTKIGNEVKKLYYENGIVARVGGKEFLVFKTKDDSKSLNEEAEILLDNLNGIWYLNGNEVPISVNIGISVYPDDGTDILDIYRNSDIALNKSKCGERNSYKVFKKSMYDDILKKSQLEKEIRKALKNEEFVLYYQPQMDIQLHRIVSFEALIRWNSPKLGWVMPGEFISLAEETSLIVPIGEWVFREACEQSIKWKNEGYDYDFISINVSTVQLRKNNFIDMVKSIFKETGADPKLIEIEITESVVMESLEKNLKIIDELKKMGIRVALDDFGSGYSSLNYLKSIPINTIKIDKTFIDGICKNSYENIITEQIIDLAHKMKLDVIAEGVEIEEQFRSLKIKNCNKIQGYYFGKPMTAKDAGIVLKNEENIL